MKKTRRTNTPYWMAMRSYQMRALDRRIDVAARKVDREKRVERRLKCKWLIATVRIMRAEDAFGELIKIKTARLNKTLRTAQRNKTLRRE